MIFESGCLGPKGPPSGPTFRREPDAVDGWTTRDPDTRNAYEIGLDFLPSLSDTFQFLIMGSDQNMVTKRHYNLSRELTFCAFYFIFRAWPDSRGPGAKFGRKAAQNLN